MDINVISRTEYDKGFLDCIAAIERIKEIDLENIRQNRKDLKEYYPARYGGGVWDYD